MKKRTTKNVDKEMGGVSEVVGLDVGDSHCHICVIDWASGEVHEESRVRTTSKALTSRFESVGRLRIGIETGVHSPWISRLLESFGHDVLVADARKLRLIYKNRQKNDSVDAEYLARLARVDPNLLHPIQHRGAEAQTDLAVLRSRDHLVRIRVQMVQHVRSVVKGVGARLPSCSTRAFGKRVRELIPEELHAALLPVVATIDGINEQIRTLDVQIESVLSKKYPEIELLCAINGVGPITALTYILVLEDAYRFSKSRKVGAFLGLVPAQDASGERQPELRITRQGDAYLRRLLVQCGHYILGPFGKDCDLRRHGEKIAQRGGKRAKKRAVVAVARKLAVVMHALWSTGQVYEPLRSA